MSEAATQAWPSLFRKRKSTTTLILGNDATTVEENVTDLLLRESSIQCNHLNFHLSFGHIGLGVVKSNSRRNFEA